MRTPRVVLAVLALLLAMVGCTTNTSPGTVRFTTNAVLQLAVGTINDPAATVTAGGTSLNVVTTFRNQFGNSAFINPGTSTLTLAAGGTSSLGKLFSYGQAPFKNGIGGLLPTYTPPNTSAFGAYSTGFVVTGKAPTSGSYGLSAAVPVNGTTLTFTASPATLPTPFTVLPAETAPAYAANGTTGGGTFTITQPAGVTESLIVVFDATFSTEIATVETTTTTATLPAGTLTPATTFNAFVIGADYPLVESGAPFSQAQSPTLTGAGGTADLTISAPSAITG